MLPGWTRISIGDHPADVFVPPGGDASKPVLFLHPVGVESLAENAAYTSAFARFGLGCCLPITGRSWWTDRLCPEFDLGRSAEAHLRQFVVPWMRETWQLGSKPIAVAGISMGGQGAVRLAFRFPAEFPIAGSLAGAFDFHEWHGRGSPLDAMYRSREAARQDTAILHLDSHRAPPHLWFACDPTDAEWFRGNDRLAEKMRATGVEFAADLTTEAGGHSWAYFDAMAKPLAEFLAGALAKQGRRLL